MIFNFGKGKIRLAVNKFNFSPGDTVTGKVSLELKKPLLAKQLRVSLIGIETSSRTSVGFGASRRRGISSSRRKDVVYRFDMPISGEKEYLQGDYPFEMQIPADTLQQKPQSSEEGLSGALMKTAQIIGGTTRSRVDWYLEAALDLDKKFDIKNKVQITIG